MTTRAGGSGIAFWDDADDTEARERYQTLVNTIDDGIYQLDSEGRFVAVNDVIAETTGYAHEDLLGEHHSVLFGEAAVSRIEREIDRLHTNSTDRSDVLELSVETASKTQVHWELRVNPIVDDDALQGAIGIARDVTEQKRQERERQRVVQALDVAQEGISLIDDDGEFIYVNDAYAETFGYDPDEMIGEHWDTLGIEANPDQFYDDILPDLADTGQWTGTTTCVRSDGSRFRGRHTLTQTEGGELICVVRDVTERRQRERALEESEQRYRTLAEYFPNGIVTLFDHDLRYTLAAGQGFDSIPVEPDEVEGQHFRDVWDDDTAEALDPLFQAALDGRERSVEVAYAGREWLIHAVPITDDRGEVFAGMTMAQDVTERKERERELEESERLYRTLAENFPDGAVGVYDHDLRYDLVEGAMWDNIEPNAEDLEGNTIHQAFSEDITDDIEPVFRAAIEEGETDSVLTEFVGRTLRVWATPLRDSSGEIFAGLSFAQDITEQRERERELEESERRYRTLAENFPNGAVGLVDEDLRYMTIGGKPLTDREMSADDLEGRPVREVLSPELAEELAPCYQAALDGESSTFEYEHADGGRHTRFRTLPVRDDEGNVFAAMGMSQDITEQVEREAELERALDLLEKTERIADVGGWTIDVDTKDVFWTDHVFDLLEVTGDEEPSLEEALDMYYEADQPIVEEAIETALDSGDPFDVEVRVRTDSGEMRWLRLQGVPEVSDGDVVSFRGAAQDITDRKERERELRQQRERLTALNNLHQVALEVNRALARQTSHEEIEDVVCDRLAASDSYEFAWIGTVANREVVPSTAAPESEYLDDLTVTTDDSPTGQGPISRAVRTGELQVVRDVSDAAAYEHWRKQDTEPEDVASAAVPIAYEDQRYGVLNIYTSRADAFDQEERDVVTQLGEIMGMAIAAAEREQELAHERERFELLNRLIRHNLLNTLNVVEARLGLLDGHVDYEVIDHLETAQDRTAEMSQLVETIRGVMRAIGNESHVLEPVDLGTVLEEEVERARQSFDHAEFEVEGDLTESGPVMADDLLEEVFENLLTNAVQHNDKETPHVTVEVDAAPETTTVRVADNGPGIPDELKDRIFQKGEMGFDSPGTGFGLYLVREIVDAYDGTITIEDNEPEGAVFSMTLPRTAAEH